MTLSQIEEGRRVWWCGISLRNDRCEILLRTGIITRAGSSILTIEADDGQIFRKRRRTLRGSREEGAAAVEKLLSLISKP